MGFKSLVPIHTWKHSLTAFSFLNLVFGAVGCLNAFPTSRCMSFFGRPVWNKIVLDTKDSGFEVKVVFTFH
jgi:hypothetical protein